MRSYRKLYQHSKRNITFSQFYTRNEGGKTQQLLLRLEKELLTFMTFMANSKARIKTSSLDRKGGIDQERERKKKFRKYRSLGTNFFRWEDF